MSKSALRTISDPTTLKIAWKHIRQRARKTGGGTAGIDGERPSHFRNAESTNITELALSLASGNYRFRNLEARILEKPSGGHRIICVPTVRDRIVQRALLHFLTVDDKCRIMNSVSYGFTKDRTVHDAASVAANLRNMSPWVYKTDIEQFFDNIGRDELKSVIKKKVRHRSLHKLLIDAASREIYEPNNSRARIITKQGIQTGLGVRQGMPLSPFFSNLFLYQFDQTIVNSGISMVRYADDLIFLCESKEECLRIDSICRIELDKLGQKLPPISVDGKTCIYEPDQTAEFLGLGLVLEDDQYVLDLTDQQRKKIRRRILQFGSVDHLLSENIDIFSFGRKIDGVIAGYLGSYSICKSFTQLEKSLADLRAKAIRTLFNDAFGIDIRKLGQSGTRFLGITDQSI